MKLTRKVLYNKARPVSFDLPWRNHKLAEELTRLMIASRGIGLAAPQCGHSVRLFVMQIDHCHKICFNPEIVEASQTVVDYTEGCLSFPGEQCTINRPDWIDVQYQDSHGNLITERLRGLMARCFQHELDHLDGITMWHRHKEQHAEQS